MSSFYSRLSRKGKVIYFFAAALCGFISMVLGSLIAFFTVMKGGF